ncbi:MAG: OadG family protein [Ignavibacteriaceae bacterium]|nr:OadG family protein [Ignavibacteriaceae bacterium]
MIALILAYSKTNDLVKNLDPIGFGMAIIGMLVVFISLILLYGVFKGIAKYFKYAAAKKTREQLEEQSEEEMSVELSAAIAAALNQYFSEIHDEESMVLTIKKVSKNYSPWSSKIYSLRNYPK